MITVTETVVTLPEVYLTVLDIDCFDDLSGACETISSDNHHTYLKGDNVWVEESAEGIKVYASMHCEGQNNLGNTLLTEDQKWHALILGFEDKEIFFLSLTVGSMDELNEQFRNFMFAGITSHF